MGFHYDCNLKYYSKRIINGNPYEEAVKTELQMLNIFISL